MSKIFIGQSLLLKFTASDQDGNLVNISSATLSLVIKKQDGVDFSRVPSLTTDGTDGQLEYNMSPSELDLIGNWHIQVIITIGANIYPSSIVKFTAMDLLVPTP